MGKRRMQWLGLSLLAVATVSVMACDRSSSDSAVAPPAASPSAPAALITVAAIDAEDAKQWNNTSEFLAGSFPYKGYHSNGHSTVPTNRPVWLWGGATPPAGATVTGYSWSGPTLSYLAGDALQQKPYFTPASPGTYTVEMTASFSDGTSADCSLNVTAANYVGQTFCAGCHAEIYKDFQRTESADFMNHAAAWSEKTTGFRANIGTTCIRCHTAGYDYQMLGGTNNPSNSGWDDPSRHVLSAPGTSWYAVADASLSGTNELPRGSGIRYTNASLLNQPAAQSDLNGIQCENCHGPGGEHFGDTSKIGRGYSEKTCTSLCHGRGHGGPYDYEQSGHFKSISMGMHLGTSCNKCHTAKGFIDVQAKGSAAEGYAAASPVTCAACHDPHTPEHHYMLRFQGEAEVSGVAVEAEVSAACVKCHTDEEAEVGHEPHHPQAEMFYGTTLAGGKGSNYPGKTYANMAHTLEVEEGCAECHMAKTLTSTGKSDPGTARTSLVQDITATTMSFLIGSNSNLPLANSTLRIDHEQVNYSSITASNGAYTVVVAARGANGTTAAAHSNGAYVTWGSNSRDRMGGHSWKVRDDVNGDDEASVSDPAAWLSTRADNHYNVTACNSCHRQFNAPETSFSGTPLRTNLTNGLALADTTITVSDNTGFPAAGTIQVGGELISYTATPTTTTFTGATRGALYGTGATFQKATGSPVPSSKFAVVVPNSIPADTTGFPNSGVLLIEYTAGNRAKLTEKIAYSSKTAASFDACLRGIDGTSGGTVQHPSGTKVTLLKGVQVVLAPSGVADHTTTLGTAMTATTPALPANITVGNATGWAASGAVKIESEFMSYTYVDPATISITARALYGTAAADHTVDATQPKVYLAAFGDSASDTILVGDTGGPLPFPVSGVVKVNGEIIRYTDKTATTLTGLTRGLAGTMAVPHMQGEVAELQIFSPYVEATGSPVSTQIPTFQAQVVSMLETLEGLLPKDDGGEVAVDGAGMTDAEKKAAFNFYFVKNDGSHGIHNFKYAMQILYDSIISMGGAPPYSRP